MEGYESSSRSFVIFSSHSFQSELFWIRIIAATNSNSVYCKESAVNKLVTDRQPSYNPNFYCTRCSCEVNSVAGRKLGMIRETLQSWVAHLAFCSLLPPPPFLCYTLFSLLLLLYQRNVTSTNSAYNFICAYDLLYYLIKNTDLLTRRTSCRTNIRRGSSGTDRKIFYAYVKFQLTSDKTKKKTTSSTGPWQTWDF